MNNDLKKMTCRICWKPVRVTDIAIRMTCMCDEDIRVIPIDRMWDLEYSHLIDSDSVEKNLKCC